MSFQIVLCLCLALSAGAFAKRDRIVGGVDAVIDEVPYQVSLRQYRQNAHFCGGSIISDKHILTAAHCVVGTIVAPFTNIRVYTGLSNSRATNGGVYKIKRVDVHPAYTGSQADAYHNDVAILTLTESIKFNDKTKKIELPTRDLQGGEEAIMSGWGILEYPSNSPSVQLQKTVQKILTPSRCNIIFGGDFHKEQICALNQRGIGICSGDSGGPLAVDGKVVGIASWVIPCGKGLPDVYTRVYSYLNFIKSVVGK